MAFASRSSPGRRGKTRQGATGGDKRKDNTLPLDATLSRSAEKILNRTTNPRMGRIPKPKEFNRHTRELKKLRSSEIWQTGPQDAQVEQMNLWFPDMKVDASQSTTCSPITNKYSNQSKYKSTTAKEVEKSPPHLPTKCPTSNIGRFAELPGELRNRIYRLVVVLDDPVKIKAEAETCSQGACLHTKTSYNVPGISNTCRQMRWEVMPIWCAENKAFVFSAAMIRNSCVTNFIRSIGEYVDFIPGFTLQLKRPIWNSNDWVKDITYNFGIVAPGAPPFDQYELHQGGGEGRNICQCQLLPLMWKMNADKDVKPRGVLLEEFVESEEFEDFVWRCHKTKQYTHHLSRCRTCIRVVFNN